jgi:hypothetical protein
MLVSFILCFSLYEVLMRDQELACNPDSKTTFRDRNDAIKRLSRFHVFQRTTQEPSLEDCEKCMKNNNNNKLFYTNFYFYIFLVEDCFEKVSEKYLKTADAMKKRYHLLQLRAMQVCE